MDKRILIIEDEEKIARVIALELKHEGYEVEMVHSGKQGLEKAQDAKWDLILLDIMIPELNGMEVLRRLRGASIQTPVILLTARDSVFEKVSGLDQGANDYITKPFQIEELLARIRACMRSAGSNHTSNKAEQSYHVADLYVDLKTRQVDRSGKDIELTPREFDLLVYLMQHKNQVLQREQILEQVWGYDYYGDTNVVDVYIRYLRKKVDAAYDPPLIQTVRGVGYSIKEPPA
ncbi:response regulator transcription factor [Bacillus horti]|uniref:DNA-binding response OmpR family regulator n=1 Tax=Caldalkalibacillus horti TaxID=77523 RepID=A0ABT9W497_9BACI|nr:response regulator transcription factor [Bacillus horti]MDQ0167899.1 DNA-binding response OmpR family regulator [Bacillus horti]